MDWATEDGKSTSREGVTVNLAVEDDVLVEEQERHKRGVVWDSPMATWVGKERTGCRKRKRTHPQGRYDCGPSEDEKAPKKTLGEEDL